jgi:hypothetical protein
MRAGDGRLVSGGPFQVRRHLRVGYFFGYFGVWKGPPGHSTVGRTMSDLRKWAMGSRLSESN